MPSLRSLSLAIPSHRVTLDDTKKYVPYLVGERRAARVQDMADSAGVRTRYTILSPAELLAVSSVDQRTRHYKEHAVSLAERASRSALEAAGLTGAQLDACISVSCTGYAMPSIDALVAQRLGFPSILRRIPIMQLGCSAGITAMTLAADLVQSASVRNALIFTVEICSLSLQTVEPSVADVVGGILFGDAAAAAVVTEEGGAFPRILHRQSVLWPGTLEELGMRLTETGFRLVLSPALPRSIQRNLRPTVDHFLASAGYGRGDIRFYAAHPGGPKILDAIGVALQLSERDLSHSWRVLQNFGNLSSATVPFILREIALAASPSEGDLGLLLALGPGVTCDMLLLQWHGTLAGHDALTAPAIISERGIDGAG
jgi:alkylresorcinol/alkylpyrone synthase